MKPDEITDFPTTLKRSLTDLHVERKEVVEHLEEHRSNTVLLTKYNKPAFVLMRAEAYLELIRE